MLLDVLNGPMPLMLYDQIRFDIGLIEIIDKITIDLLWAYVDNGQDIGHFSK